MRRHPHRRRAVSTLRIHAAASAARCGRLPPANSAWLIVTRQVKTDLSDPAVRNAWHAMLTSHRAGADYKPGWVAHQYKTKFGTWPPRGDVTPQAATPKFCPGCARADRLRQVAEGGMNQTPAPQEQHQRTIFHTAHGDAGKPGVSGDECERTSGHV